MKAMLVDEKPFKNKLLYLQVKAIRSLPIPLLKTILKSL